MRNLPKRGALAETQKWLNRLKPFTRVERCKSSGLLMALARATPGTKLQNGYLGLRTRKLPINLTSILLVDGVLTVLNVVTPLSKSWRAEPRPLTPHVYFIQLNGKARMSGDYERSVRARPNAGTRRFDFRFRQTS